MNLLTHKTEGVDCTKTMRFLPFIFTGNDPRKGWRIPLNKIKYNEQRDEEPGYGYLPQQVRQAYHGARYMDHVLTTMWLSVDPMADKYPSISPYAYCAWNPVKLVDPDGNDWYEIVNEETGEKEIKWTDFHSQEEMDDNKQAGTYLGEVFVQFNGSSNESLGDDNTMTGEGANPATVTIYGKNNEKDIHTYKGMTTPYSDSYSTLDEGDYRAYYEDMATSVYGEAGARKKNTATALTYRITQLDGNKTLKGKRNGKPIDMTSVFMHRTNWDGNASKSSKGCLVIDGRSWRDVENQIGKSSKIYIRVIR